jgi:hypothetical protein
MPIRHSICAAALAAAVLAPPARADGGPSPGVYQGWNGVADSVSGVRFVALAADRGAWTVLARIKLNGGTVLNSGSLRGSYGIPALTWNGDVGGLSPNGRVLVVAETATGSTVLRSVSRFAVLAARTLRARTRIALRGDFSFDALSPDGRMLFLIQHTSERDLRRYRVRAYDLALGRLLPDAIVDRSEPNMRGLPIARTATRTGAWVYTLYQGDETFVHALDTVHARAVCLDLLWHGSRNGIYQMHIALRDGGGQLTLVNRHGNTEATLNLRPARRRSATATWAAAGLSGAGLAATALFLWRRAFHRRPDSNTGR